MEVVVLVVDVGLITGKDSGVVSGPEVREEEEEDTPLEPRSSESSESFSERILPVRECPSVGEQPPQSIRNARTQKKFILERFYKGKDRERTGREGQRKLFKGCYDGNRYRLPMRD